MRVKKAIAVCVTCIVAMGLLTDCGSSSNQSVTASSTKQEAGESLNTESSEEKTDSDTMNDEEKILL